MLTLKRDECNDHCVAGQYYVAAYLSEGKNVYTYDESISTYTYECLDRLLKHCMGNDDNQKELWLGIIKVDIFGQKSWLTLANNDKRTHSSRDTIRCLEALGITLPFLNPEVALVEITGDDQMPLNIVTHQELIDEETKADAGCAHA